MVHSVQYDLPPPPPPLPGVSNDSIEMTSLPTPAKKGNCCFTFFCIVVVVLLLLNTMGIGYQLYHQHEVMMSNKTILKKVVLYDGSEVLYDGSEVLYDDHEMLYDDTTTVIPITKAPQTKNKQNGSIQKHRSAKPGFKPRMQ